VIVGSGNFFSPIVGDLDKAIAFYRDGIGLDVTGAPANADANPALRNMFGLPDAQIRWSIGRPPAMRTGVEIVEPRTPAPGRWNGASRTPARSRLSWFATRRAGPRRCWAPCGDERRGPVASHVAEGPCGHRQGSDGQFQLTQPDPLPPATVPIRRTSSALRAAHVEDAEKAMQRTGTLWASAA
jgi:hypothetical protein